MIFATRLVGVMALAISLGLPAAGQATTVDLEIFLAVDVSHSVDPEEARLQRDGYVQALAHPLVVREIENGLHGRIAVAYVEFAGQHHQRVVADWAIIDGRASARAFVAAIAREPIGTAPYTSISAAIDYGRHSIKTNGVTALRSVIDVSGDGPNSDGRAIGVARDAAIAEGITINGLPITSSRPNPNSGGVAVHLANHYSKRVIGGPGAFLIEAFEFESFAAALLKKLIREIRGSRTVIVGQAP
jgi:hypothetical protein